MRSRTVMFSTFEPSQLHFLSEDDQKKTILQLLSTDKSKMGVILDYRCFGSEIIIDKVYKPKKYII